MAFSYRRRARRAPLKRRRSAGRRRNPFMGKRMQSRRGYGRGALTAANKQAAFLRIGGALGIESKCFDRYLPTTFVPSPTGTSADSPARYLLSSIHLLSSAKELCTPSQGVTSSSRDGRSINCQSIVVRGCVVSEHAGSVDPATTGDSSCLGRIQVYVALVLDTQTNSLAMNPVDCFDVDGQTSTDWAGANIVAGNRHIMPPMMNIYHRKRFRVLSSQVVTLGPADLDLRPGDGVAFIFTPRSAHFELKASLAGLRINFNSDAGAVSTITDNSIHLVAYTDLNRFDATGTLNTSEYRPRINYFSRFRFSG